jgi:aclacinomycin oxidase
MNAPTKDGSSERALAERMGPADRRYDDPLRRSFNERFGGKPDYLRLVGSTEQVVEAVQSAVAEGRRVAVRSGGYCMEGFVANPQVRVVIDMSLMTSISYDAAMGAFAVDAGATLGEVYRKLALGWGVGPFGRRLRWKTSLPSFSAEAAEPGFRR